MRPSLIPLCTHLGSSGQRGLPQLIKDDQATSTPDLVTDVLIDDLERPRDSLYQGHE
jgi:hypothetical protein